MKTIALAIGGILSLLMGLTLCFREQFPHYRTVEISPGFYDELWASDKEVALTVLAGCGLLVLALFLFWKAYRTYRCSHIKPVI